MAVCGAALAFGSVVASKEDIVDAGSGVTNRVRQASEVGAPGRIEGSANTVDVGTVVTAVVSKLFVHESDFVKKGDAIVEFECKDLEAELDASRADAEVARLAYVRMQEGSRPEEIAAADAQRKASEAVLAQANLRRSRAQSLGRRGLGSIADVDESESLSNVASAQRDSASAMARLTRLGPPRSELERAAAQVDAAAARMRENQAKVARCTLRSPTDGKVLRVHVEVGELVTAIRPKPVVTVADTSFYRVRAEVDERDGKFLRVGQKARVRLVSDPTKQIMGEVSEILPAMGRKEAILPSASEFSDRDIVEVLIRLEPAFGGAPVGMKVSVTLVP